MKSKISVIVPTYNRKGLLEKCLTSLFRQSYRGKHEIIVVDDGSSDGTKNLVKKLQKRHKNLRYFYQKNKGPAAARNLGIRKSRGKIVAFTDDDCVVNKDWLKNIATSFKQFPKVVAVGGSILNPYKSKIGWADYILNFSSWYPLGKKRSVRDIPSANIAYKKDVIQNMLFPEGHIGLVYEDSIFNYNLTRAGKTLLFNRNIKVSHYRNRKNAEDFLENQRRYGLSFLLRGYKIHGSIGKILVKFKLLNLFCPRLILVFLRCLKSKKYLAKFITSFPLILRGEFERGRAIMEYKKPKYVYHLK